MRSNRLPDSDVARAIHAEVRAFSAIRACFAGVSSRKPPASMYCPERAPRETQFGDFSYFILRSRTSNRHSSAAFESAFADSSSRVLSVQPTIARAITAVTTIDGIGHGSMLSPRRPNVHANRRAPLLRASALGVWLDRDG